MSRAPVAEALVAVHSTVEAPKIDPNRCAMAVATKILGEFGVGVVFVPRDGYGEEPDRTVAAHRANVGPDGSLILADTSETLALGANVRLVRAYSTGRMPDWLDAAVPVLNGPALNGLSRDKYAQISLAPELFADTVFVASGQEYDPDTSTLNGDKVVVKANSGYGGKLVRIVDNNPDQISSAIADLRAKSKGAEGGWLVQEFDPGKAMRDVRSNLIGPAELIAEAGANVPTEMRVYCFVDRVGGELSVRPYAMYRLNPGTEQGVLLPIDQSTVPAIMIENAANITARVLGVTGRQGGVIAVDQYISSVNGGVRVREVNSRNPVVGDRVALAFEGLPKWMHPEVIGAAQNDHGRLLAQQMATLALGAKRSI